VVINRFFSVGGAALSALLFSACAVEEADESITEEEILVEEIFDSLPNNFPFPNAYGISAAATASGSVDLDNAFFTAQGTNGRNCGTCHAPENGWSLNPGTIRLMFLVTDGMHPLFVNNLDTDTPTCDMTTRSSRWDCTTMLRQGKFTRRINMPNTVTREFDMTAFNDPFAVTTASQLWFFRRVLPTHTFKTGITNWDNSNGVASLNVRDGLRTQARGNISGAQQGPSLTIDDPIVQEIADYQLTLGHAQTYLHGAGSTTAEGAKGGPLNAVNQPLVNARFDMFDEWADSKNKHRRQVFRGQELFNNKTRPNGGGACRGCHNASNHGGNVNNTMFNVGASDVVWAKPDMAVFTFTSRIDGTVVQTTDPGRAIRSGRMSDMNRFDTPTLRGLAARAPYFHNAIAEDIPAVIDFYEQSLGFDFTEQEEKDLEAFLAAL
jgi:cytochrome c peroxidase